MYDTQFEILLNNITYEYVGNPFCTQKTYKKYEEEIKKPIESWTLKDFEETDKLFEELIPEILNLKLLLNNIEILKKERKIRWPKIIIFSLYLLCWGYILIISYYNYPVELVMFKNVVQYIIIELMKGENPFTYDIYFHFENLNKK